MTGEVTHCEALLNFELDICLCRSQAKKDGAEDDVAKYDGAWAVEPLAKVTQKSQYEWTLQLARFSACKQRDDVLLNFDPRMHFLAILVW